MRRTSAGSSTAVEAVDQPRRHLGPAELGHPADLAGVRDRHDPRQHGLVDAELVELLDEADVVGGLEEELGDREVGPGQLGGEEAAVGGPVRGAGVDLGVGGHADREVGVVDVADEVRGVPVVRGPAAVRTGREVPPEGEDVLDAGGPVVVEDLGDLLPPVALTRQVGHRGDGRLLAHPADDVTGALTTAAAGAVGHRHEAGVQRLQLGDGAAEGQLGTVGLGREELERVRPPRREEIGHPGHGSCSRYRSGPGEPGHAGRPGAAFSAGSAAGR